MDRERKLISVVPMKTKRKGYRSTKKAIEEIKKITNPKRTAERGHKIIHINMVPSFGRNAGKIAFQIVEQTKRGEEFGSSPYSSQRHVFKTRSGIELKSVGSPEWRPRENVLFVRGSSRGMDKNVIYCTKEDFKKIQSAIDEYNNKFGGIRPSIQLPDDLFTLD